MKVFVAGATGVLGRRVVPLLKGAGHEVSGVARRAASAARLERHGAAAVAVDLFDADAVRSAVAGHDAVLSLATHIPTGSRLFLPGAWRENDRIRRVASLNLADAAIAARSRLFVQESFGLAYPDRGGDWIDETTPLATLRYNRSLLDAERSAARVSRSGGTGIVLRFAGFYGPDSPFTLDAIRSAKKGRAAAVGAETGYLSSVSHDDAATAVVAVLDAPAGTYNVADDEPLTRREHFDALAIALGAAAPAFPPAWLSHLFGSLGATLARSVRISNRKLREATGWKPELSSVRQGWRAVVGALETTARAA